MNHFKKPLLRLACPTILYASLAIANPFMVLGQGAGPNITVEKTENTYANQPALTGIQARMGFSSFGAFGVVYTVPAGHRLVIEHVSVRTTNSFDVAVVWTKIDAELVEHYLIPVNDPFSPGATVSQQTTFYADPESEVEFSMPGFISDPSTGIIVISGHLVPIP